MDKEKMNKEKEKEETQTEDTNIENDVKASPEYIALKEGFDNKIKELEKLQKEVNTLKVEKEKKALQFESTKKEENVDDCFLSFSKRNYKRG